MQTQRTEDDRDCDQARISGQMNEIRKYGHQDTAVPIGIERCVPIDARLAVFVYIDLRGRDLGTAVREMQQSVADPQLLPAGYSVSWSGQLESLERNPARLQLRLAFRCRHSLRPDLPRPASVAVPVL